MENGGAAAAETAGILEAGARLGKYEIRRLIGLGSMSAIYEGARPDTGRRVALKVLSPKHAGVPAARARFLTEAKLTARVRHAHVIDVIEVGEDGERSYLAMEMLEGEDLARRLRHARFLSAAETADILVPVCEAVAAAHASGIVHRDLKPANIFLAIRDEKIHPVVLDFGIANDNDVRALSGSQLVFGTPYYLSPEQIADHRAASPASDQWALGVILYECLTGARPYDGDSLDAVFAAIGAGRALLPSARRSGISSELGQIVMRAMSSNPSARFASVTALAQALRPFRSGLAGTSPSSRRRVPSSPVIAAEASTQSPFTRTLTPEVDVLDGLWFEPDPTEDVSGDVTLPPANLSGQKAFGQEVSDAEAQSSEAWPTFANRWTERWRSASGQRFSPRRIGAVAGGALGGLALVFLLARGGSVHRASSQGTAVVTDREAVIAKEPTPLSSLSVAAAKEPAAAAQPAVKEPAVAKAQPEALKEEVAVKEPAAVKDPSVVEQAAKPQPTPVAIRTPKAERHERVAPVPTQTPTAIGSVPHDTAERPRARTSSDVRMHNGVPLLD